MRRPCWDEHAGGGAEVDFSPEAVLEIPCVSVATDRVAMADRVHHRAGFLHRAVLVEVERDDRAYAGLRERLEERRQPAGLDERVAVQEAEVAAASPFGSLVGGTAEAAVGLVADDRRALGMLLDPREGVVRRGVVHEQELEARLGVVRERRDRPRGDLSAAVEHHHNRDERVIEPGQRYLRHGLSRPSSRIARRMGAV